MPTSLIMRRACRRVPSGDRNRSHCFSVFNVMRHLPLFFFSHGAGNGLDLLMISFQEKKLEIAASLQEHGRWQRIFVLILFFHDLPVSGGADGKLDGTAEAQQNSDKRRMFKVSRRWSRGTESCGRHLFDAAATEKSLAGAILCGSGGHVFFWNKTIIGPKFESLTEIAVARRGGGREITSAEKAIRSELQWRAASSSNSFVRGHLLGRWAEREEQREREITSRRKLWGGGCCWWRVGEVATRTWSEQIGRVFGCEGRRRAQLQRSDIHAAHSSCLVRFKRMAKAASTSFCL